MLLLEGLFSGFNTITSLLGNTNWGENKNNFWAGASWVGLYRLVSLCQNVASGLRDGVTFVILGDMMMC